MERLLLLRLESQGCAAEAQLNGFPVAATPPQGGRVVLPVHEYTQSGRNRLAIVVGRRLLGDAPSEPRVAGAGTAVRLSLALAHSGQAANDPNVRVLASKDWTPAEGEDYDAPLEVGVDVELPVAFSRWRWLDAPVIPEGAAAERVALEFVQRIAADFARGDPERFLAAARLRFEELALAYQRPAAELVQRFRAQLQALYAAKALVIAPPAGGELLLRRIADGRLLDCLTPLGEPALRTAPAPDGSATAWPLRLAVVENKVYVLR